MPRISLSVGVMALLGAVVFLVMSIGSVSAAAGDATLGLEIKPCDPKQTPTCDTAEMLVKDNITVSVSMKSFNLPGGIGYDAWETSVCFPHDELIFKSLEFAGGPQGNQVVDPRAPDAKSGDTSCILLGASVGVGEASSQDLGNLADISFSCKQPNKDTIVYMQGGVVILGDNDKKPISQGNLVTTVPTDDPKIFVDIDCRAGSYSISVNGAFFEEPITEEDLIKGSDGNPALDPTNLCDEDKGDCGTRYHMKAGDKFKVTFNIDELRNLDDKDNPEDGGGYTDLDATFDFNIGDFKDNAASGLNQFGKPVLETVTDNAGDTIAGALVECTGEASGTRPEADVTTNTNDVSIGCASDKGQVDPEDSDENNATGAVLTLTLMCNNDLTQVSATFFATGSGATQIKISGVALDDEQNEVVNLFDRTETVLIDCIGDINDKDEDGCIHLVEAGINELSQAIFGVDAMDPNIFDYPDADNANTPLNITIGDVLAYVQNFGLNDPALGPNATEQGAASDPPSTVHDVSQPNNDQIGTDDILRAALLFGVPCDPSLI